MNTGIEISYSGDIDKIDKDELPDFDISDKTENDELPDFDISDKTENDELPDFDISDKTENDELPDFDISDKTENDELPDFDINDIIEDAKLSNLEKIDSEGFPNIDRSNKSTVEDFEKSISNEYLESQQVGFLPRKNGDWEDEPGNSVWIPCGDCIPKLSNLGGKTWDEILKNHGIKGIPFINGYPDFSEISKETVEIGDLSKNRNTNFNQADKKTVDKWNEQGKDGRTDWAASEVKQYRKDNNLTWHECEDKKTLQLVPSEIHINIPHRGGISVLKQETKDN